MAKTPKTDGVDKSLLNEIVTATNANSFVYTSQTAHQPMIALGLVEVNTSMPDPADPTKFATRATAAAAQYLSAAPAAAPAAAQAPASEPSKYTVMKGIALPEAKKRGNHLGSGAPTKYPFATMEVGDVFFSGNSEHAKNDALKALGSTVSSQNRKYATPDGDKTKVIKQAERGADKKPVVGPDGKKVIVSKTVPVLKYERKFTIRAVTAGYGNDQWKAPEAGVLISRTI
jgi:hypothetical protein